MMGLLGGGMSSASGVMGQMGANAMQGGGRASSKALRTYALSQYQPMQNYATVGRTLGLLNNMGGGQQPYQPFMQGYQNPYIQGLLGGGYGFTR